MGSYNTIVYRIGHYNIVCSRCKFRGLIEINAITFDYSIVVIYAGIFDSIAAFNLCIIESAFTIDFITFARNGRRPYI